MPNLSLLEEARSRRPLATDAELIVDVVADLIDVLDLAPPVDPEMVASYQGIRRIVRSPLAWAGCLVTEGDELTIHVRDSDPVGRQRFTICHEVAHTFFPGFRFAPQYRCTPLSTRSARDPIEVLCDLAASELLMPARHISTALQSASFDLDTVHELAGDCDASIEAAARRLVSLWPEPCALIRLELMTKPSAPNAEPKLRVTSTFTNGTWPYMPRHKSLGDHHVLNDCLNGAYVDCVTDIDDLTKGVVGPVEVHARHYPFSDNEGVPHERVLVLARRAR